MVSIRHKFIFLLIITLFLFPSTGMGHNKNYISAQVGNAIPVGKLTQETIRGDLTIKKPLKSSIIYNVNVGREVFNNIFLELEAAYSEHKFSNSYIEPLVKSLLTPVSFKVKVQSVNSFVNLSYRFDKLNISIIPYLVAGIGVSSNKVHNGNINLPLINYSVKGKTTVHYAWQVGVGLLVPITQNLDIHFSYRYRDLGGIKSSNLVTNPINSKTFISDLPIVHGKLFISNILLGITLNF